MSAAQRRRAGAAAEPAAAGDTRERLIRAASELLADGGPDAVTMRRVGELAGVSRAAPYRHFDDKHDLLRAVALRSLEKVHAEVAAELPTARTRPDEVPAALRRAFHAYLRHGVDRPEHYRLMFGEHLSHVDGTGVHEAAEGLMQLSVDSLAEGQRAGVVRSGDPRAMAILSWSALHGLVTLAGSGHLARKGLQTEEGGELAALVADLVAGLVRREEPAGRPESGTSGSSPAAGA
ncbi:TetR/AcrR family transcriptional regulator [Streptomonospora wellingtoniae]|uniref:TetR/AcrR family transcriptional regulator n=1 Tax=Streptomonospora wellingtoniae TaxID=3075544 RepID=A0ABU2KTE5_9ACTN|nr:TetR/AcrR family transcriptional regulator [Streptomonospora sp. DSM 45055]MDT0302523.1 TetR/AcrR family transcriptional regulator [Streptomonospora sp. DSM 45055]